MTVMNGARGARRRAASIAGIALVLALTACSGQSGPSVDLPDQASGSLAGDITDQIDAAAENAMALAAAPGAIVGVWAPWSGSSVSGYGTTTVGGKTEMTGDMSFRIANNTRALTCSVLLSLVDDGKVALEDAVSEYLPGRPGLDSITLGQLCTGQSGIADYHGNLDKIFAENPARIWDPNELFNDGFATGVTAAGDSYKQSDTAYVLLGMALEAATSTSMNDLYQEYVSKPLALSSTSLPSETDLDLPSGSPSGYVMMKDGDGKRKCDDPTDESKLSSSQGFSAGGVVSTADELHTFAQAFATGVLYSEETAAVQDTTVEIGGKAPSWQTFGFGVYHFGPMYGQYGSIPGFISAMLVDPASGLTVVVMLNNSTAGSNLALDLAKQVASYASKAEAAKGYTAPTIDLPWSAEQAAESMAGRAICQ